MSVTLKQYSGSQVLPKDDAILYDSMLGQSGIIYGCASSWTSSNSVLVAAGYGVIKGRLFAISEETVSVKLPTSGTTTAGKLYVKIDLSNTTTPISIESSISSSDITQEDDFNYSNGIYSILLGTYAASTTAITSYTDAKTSVSSLGDLVTEVKELVSSSISDIESDIEDINSQLTAIYEALGGTY